ncbi:hypothetical protein ACO0M4_23460 [Streptomyces sp. RGM 3693]|uniref:hypothetical protein n=1 Tax=Streptomyces sp. RGM 3693 TaxID=3413284 RepID=UPI003D275771
MHRIASLFLPLLRLLLPADGRHRTPDTPPAAPSAPRREDPQSWIAPLRAPARPPVLLRGEDVPLVRPYVLTEAEREERRERRLRRGRRRALWLAVHGLDVGPRRIHGVEVAA